LPQVTANFDDTDARLTVKDGAGYAILVVGSLDDSTNVGNSGLGEGQFEHTKTMDFVYSTFRDRGFAAEDIFYLREPTETAPSGIPTANLDETPSQADFMTAITTWAQGKMNAAPAPLYVVMLDHGFPDEFFLFDPNNSPPFGPDRVVTPEEMDGWLTTLEGSLDGIRDDGTPDEAADQDLVIVYGACYSGSFIDDDPGVTGVDSISGTGRIIVTSSQANELSHRGAVDAADGIRDGELFTTEFFRELRAGYNMKVAFETASGRVVDFTLSRSNGGDPNAVPEQQPLLDDNGDWVGTLAAQLSVNPGDDGAIAFELELGFGESNPAGSVGLLQVTPTTALSLNESLPQLFAKATDATTLHEAWIEVKAPDYVGSSASDVTQTSGGGEDLSLFQREVLMFQFDSDQNDGVNTTPPASGDYTFTDTLQDRTSTVSLASLMSGSGTYQVYYFIRDAASGEVSSFLITNVLRDSNDNDPPSSVSLLLPANAVTVEPPVFFAWTESFDPDGDSVTYRLEMDTAPGLDTPTANLLIKENIVDTFTTSDDLRNAVTSNLEALKFTTYYWRVVAVDSFGLEAASAERSLFADPPNAAIPGRIAGAVLDAQGDIVPVFTVTPTGPSGVVPVVTSNGVYYAPDAPEGTYSVQVSAPGFVTQTQNNIDVITNATSMVDFTMVADGSGTDLHASAASLQDIFDSLDANSDGKLSFSESGLSASDFNDLDTNSDSYLTLEELLDTTLGGGGDILIVWAMFTTADPGSESGSEQEPFNTIVEASARVDSGGVVKIKPSQSEEVITLSKAMRLEAPSGTARIGVAPQGFQALLVETRASQESSSLSESTADDIAAALRDADSDEAERAFNAAVFEAIVPNATNADGDIMVLADGRLALRLRDYTGLEFETLWAELHPQHDTEEVSFDWEPVAEGDDRDIWVFFSPTDTWYLNDLLVIAAGGANADGAEVLSNVHAVQVETQTDYDARTSESPADSIAQPDYAETDEAIGNKVSLTIAVGVPQFDDLTIAYRIQPDQVFDTPQRIWLPVGSGVSTDNITLMYYKGNEPNQGWHNAQDVAGFLADTEPVVVNGYLGVVVNHAGVVAVLEQ